VKRTVVFTAGVLAIGLAGYLGSQLRAQQPTAAGTAQPTAAEPRTRVALLNLAYVIKNYTKWKTFQDEIKGDFKNFDARVQAKQKIMEETGKRPATTPEQQDAVKAEITKLKREVEDINNEAKMVLGKKSDEQMVILYREIQDAAQRYAMAHNFELVLHYTEATTQADYYSAANIARKLQAGGLVPLYQVPGLDISREVVMALNAAYARQAPQGTHPAGN
jgi:Skp family chaperone for outer membrane proteins